MNDEDSTEVEFGQQNTPSSFKDVVMSQLNKVNNFFNVEFRGGYTTNVPTKDGGQREIYVQDSREVFCNATLALALLIKPRFNPDMQKAFEKYQEDLENIKNDFISKSIKKEEIILGDGFYDNEKDRVLLETYKMKKLDIYIDLYCQLSQMLSNRNYFGITGGTF